MIADCSGLFSIINLKSSIINAHAVKHPFNSNRFVLRISDLMQFKLFLVASM